MQVQNTRDCKKSQEMQTFNEKKLRSYLLADSFRRIGPRYDARAGRVLACGRYLEFATHKETGDRHLIAADFCRDRLCPMCNWRRSRRVFSDLSKVLSVVQAADAGYIPVFLTLTVRNSAPEVLRQEIVKMTAAWNRFCKILAVKRAYVGWFRCLEITYNRKDNTMHPHFHVVMIAHKDYFSSPDYLSIHKIVKYWRQALMVDYDPVCHIRRIRDKQNRTDSVRSAVLEVAKYAVKDTDFLIENNDDLTDYLVDNLAVGLNGARLIAYGGILKKFAAAIKAGDDVDDFGDDRCSLRDDVNYVVTKFRWTAGVGKYMNE